MRIIKPISVYIPSSSFFFIFFFFFLFNCSSSSKWFSGIMEHSTNSSMNQPISSNGKSCGFSEESGWTVYFEDFFSNNRDDDDWFGSSSNSNYYGSPSLVSDAASSAPWKFSDDNNNNNSNYLPDQRNSKKLNFKKNRIIRGGGVSDHHHDDALEDTASSPVNSPKISDLRKYDSHPRRKDASSDCSSQGRKCSSSKNSSEMNNDIDHHEMREMDFNGKQSDCAELKKRGLCLVPLSMLMNYIG